MFDRYISKLMDGEVGDVTEEKEECNGHGGLEK